MRAFLAIVAVVVWTGYWFAELFLHNRVRALGRGDGPDPMLQALVWVAGVIVILLVARFLRRRAGEG
jgi:hypothetical protein